jgi:hypothetical protein
MSFDLIKLKIKVNLEKLQSYYEIVERDFQHLCWNVGSTVVVDHDGVGGHRVKEMYGWAIHSNALDLTQPCPPYNIGLQKSDTYHWTELDFGIIEDFKQAFPFAHGFSIATHPPGTFINSHIDSDDWIKIHVPISVAPESYFYFDNNEYHMECDGSMYLVNTMIPHGTDNRGTDTRAHLIFKIPASMAEHVQSMEGVIG